MIEESIFYLVFNLVTIVYILRRWQFLRVLNHLIGDEEGNLNRDDYDDHLHMAGRSVDKINMDVFKNYHSIHMS
jgi:hypothetical protein